MESFIGHAGKPPYPLASGKHRTLEEELCFWVSYRTSLDRNKEIAIRYFGFDGSGGATLKEVGMAYGITRERVRQICAWVSRVLQRLKPNTPVLEKCIRSIARQLPSETEEVEKRLHTQGLIRGKFTVENIIRAAKVFGQQVSFVVEFTKGRRFVLPLETRKLVRCIWHVANRAVIKYGLATIDEVVAQVNKQGPLGGDAGFVTQVLRARSDFSWLEKTSGCFWIRSLLNNRVANRIRKILAVAGRIRVGQLSTGIGKGYKMKGWAPPRRLLLKLCRQLPGYRIQGDFVSADPPLDWQAILNGIELTMARILKKHGPILGVTRFRELCVANGIQTATFLVYLPKSPIIKRFARGVYGLRGAKLPGGLSSPRKC